MNGKLKRLSLERAELLRLAREQRLQLRQETEVWREPLATADRGFLALRYLRDNPYWVLGGLLVVVVARPARVWRWLEIGLFGWQMGRRITRQRFGLPPPGSLKNSRASLPTGFDPY